MVVSLDGVWVFLPRNMTDRKSRTNGTEFLLQTRTEKRILCPKVHNTGLTLIAPSGNYERPGTGFDLDFWLRWRVMQLITAFNLQPDSTRCKGFVPQLALPGARNVHAPKGLRLGFACFNMRV